jgi:flagellar operon protein
MNVRQLAARIDAPRVDPRAAPGQPQAPQGRASVFADELRRAREFGGAQEDVKVSAHAQQRLEQREISFTEDERQAIAEAVRHLSGKGSREALLIRADAAFVVNVPNRTIVTAVNQAELKEKVFTNIDSAMML